LAAAALRDYRCEEVSASLDDGLGVLSTSLLDMPADHRSMQRALDRPWSRLNPAQQELVILLAGYEDEITPNDKAADRRELDELVDRGLLETGAPGHFRMHPLVRLYLREKKYHTNTLTIRTPVELPGRSMFWDRLEHMLARARRYEQTAAVILLTVSEMVTAGSSTGNQDQIVLRELISCLRKSDTAVLLDRGMFGFILEDISRAEDSLLVGKKFSQVWGSASTRATGWSHASWSSVQRLHCSRQLPRVSAVRCMGVERLLISSYRSVISDQQLVVRGQ
jgi:hypothetical protein